MKKFELTADKIKSNGVTLHRIKALIDFGDVKAGDLGGYVEKEENLSQYGRAWVSGNARVYGDAWVFCSAQVYGDAQVFGNAYVYGSAQVYGDAWVYDKARLSGNARVYGNACVSGNAQVSSDADYICLKGFGSRNRNTTMFRTENGNIYVSCGCFIGSLQEFENKVKETHGNNKFAKEYLALVEAAKIHFEV